MLRAGPIHIAVIDAVPQCTFHHDELHLAQPFSGIVVALVGLLRILRVSELTASPRPAPTAPEKAHVLRRKRRKRPRPPTLPHDPQKCARERARQISLHMERLAALRWRRRRLSRARRLAPAASAGWATAARRHQETGRGRVRRGERPSHHRSWTQSSQHRGPRRPG